MVNVMLIDDHPVVRAGLRAILNTFHDIDVVLEGSDGSAVEKLLLDDVPPDRRRRLRHPDAGCRWHCRHPARA